MKCPRCGHAAPELGALVGVCPQCLARDLNQIEGNSAHPPIPDEAAAGERCGRYLKVKELGCGGMGEVWKAWDTLLGRWVALKFLKGDIHDHERFLREARIAGALTHPNIAAVYETGEVEGRLYIAFQYLEGLTLELFPRRDRRKSVMLVRDAALAMDYAHANGIIHRDLKPSNLMAVPSSESPGQHRVCILDFGLARPIGRDHDLSQTGVVLGTPAYMSPEQAGGETLDARSDVYGLGATLYELLSGRPPFSGKDVYEILEKIREEDPGRLRRVAPDIPQDLETVVLKCLEKDPARRYSSARTLADDLTRYLEGKPVDARPPSLVYHLSKWIRRNSSLSTAYAAVILVLIAAGVLFTRGVHERKRQQAQVEEAQRAALGAALERANEREREAEAAKKALERSEALRLAAHSAGVLATNPTLALLLALEAGKRSSALPVHNAVRSSMDALREVKTLDVAFATHWASFSADGKLLLTTNGSPRLWDGRTGDLRRVFPMEEYCNGAVLSPDGRWMLAPVSTGNLYLWSIETGKPVIQLRRPAKPGAARAASLSLSSNAFSPDSKRFVLSWEENTAAIMDSTTGQPILLLKGHEGPVSGANFSADGARVVTWSRDQTVRVWNATDGSSLVTLDELRRKEDGGISGETGRPMLLMVEQAVFSADSRHLLVSTMHGSKVWNLDPLRKEYDLGVMSRFASFSPDGKRLVSFESGAQFAQVYVHNLETRKVTATLRGHQDAITSASFHPSGRWVTTASFDRTVRFWDVATGAEIAKIGHPGKVDAAIFSPDGSFLYSATSRTAHLWNTQSGGRRRSLTNPGTDVRKVALSPDGRKVALQRDHSTTQVWDLDQRKMILDLKQSITGARFTPDGKSIYGTQGNVAGIWNASTGERRALLSGHEDRIFDVSLNPAADTFITTGKDGNVFLWDAQGRRLPASIHTPKAHFAPCQLSPDGSLLAVPEQDHILVLYDFPALTRKRECVGHTDAIQSIGWSPDGRWLFSVGRDSTIKVWNSATAELRCSIATMDYLHSPRFGPDGRSLLAMTSSKDSATVELWDVPDARRIYAVTEPEGGFWSLVTSADATKWLIHSGATAALFETESGKKIRKLILPGGHVAGFHPDGKRLFYVSEAGLSVVDAESGEPVGGELRDTGRIFRFHFSPDGKRIVLWIWGDAVVVHDLVAPNNEPVLIGSARLTGESSFSPDGKRIVTPVDGRVAKVWDAATGERVQTLGPHSGPLVSAEFSDDGASILTRTQAGKLALWGAADGKKLVDWAGAESPLKQAALIPGARKVIAVHQDGRVMLHDETGARPLPVGASILQATVSPSGDRVLLLEGSQGASTRLGSISPTKRTGIVRLWDLAAQREIRQFVHDRPISNALWTAEGRQVLTLENADQFNQGASWQLHLWDAATGLELRQLGGAVSGIGSLRTSRDGRYVFVGAPEFDAVTTGGRLFDLQGGVELASFPPDILWTEAFFPPDGRSLVTLSSGGEVRVQPTDPFTAALSLSPRRLTPDEMEQYEVGTPEDRVRRRWEALDPLLRDIEVGLAFHRELPEHKGGLGFVRTQLTLLKTKLDEPALKGPAPAPLRKLLGTLRTEGAAFEHLQKVLGEVLERLDALDLPAPAQKASKPG